MLEDVKAQLKAKVDASTAEVINHNREAKKLLDKKDDEIKALKSSIRNGTAESSRMNSEFKNLQKTLKAKEKEVYNLENYKTNQQETVKNAKREATNHKAEKVALEKRVKHLEKKVDDLKNKNTVIEMNNNISKSLSTMSTPITASSSMKVSSAAPPDVDDDSIGKSQTVSNSTVITISDDVIEECEEVDHRDGNKKDEVKKNLTRM